MKESIKGKKIALIGGAGFIGHHLALHLKQAGADVHVIDGLQVNNLLYLNQTDKIIPNRDLYIQFINDRLGLLRKANIPLHVEDARNYFKLCQIFNQIGPQIIILLAAVSHANRSNKDPFSTFDHSLRTLENALDNSRETIEHFIYFSSSMVYGNFEKDVITESDNCNPIGIYGALKYGAEKLVIAYNQVFDLPYTIIRPSALYGPRCISNRVGQAFIESTLFNKEIQITGDGSDRLDFTYIYDLIAGVKNIIENKNSINQIFNITLGKSRSISELVEILNQDFPNVKIKYTSRNKLTPKRGTLSIEKAREMLNYKPLYSLEKGFKNYIKWYKNFFFKNKEKYIDVKKMDVVFNCVNTKSNNSVLQEEIY